MEGLVFKSGGDPAGSCNPGWGYMVALDSKTMKRVSFVDFSCENGITFIEMIEVQPDYWGQGVEVQLLDHLQSEAGDNKLQPGSNMTDAAQELFIMWENKHESSPK